MYDRYYQEFCDEVHKILSCYLFWKTLNKQTAKDEKLLSALNKTPLSWLVIRDSLNVALFMTLGRVFDPNNDSFSVDELLKCCIEEVDSFSKNSLRNRKMEGQNGVEPEWLIDYIEKSYEPNAEDFEKLRIEVEKHRKIFVKVYRPIRHKLIAHNDKKYMDKADELWTETDIDELEEIIWFLNDLKETLFDSYHNGRKPLLTGRDPSLDFYERDFRKLLERIKNT